MSRKRTTDGVGEIPDAENIVLGYLSCPTDTAGGFVGALLITDYRTRPLQFAHVPPVRPTKMQRILYRSTLSEHVKIDCIAKKLFFDGVSCDAHIVFVDDAALLSARRLVDTPVAHLCRSASSATGEKMSAQIRYNTGGNQADYQTVETIVSRIDPSIDLLEPFDRILDALKEVLKAQK